MIRRFLTRILMVVLIGACGYNGWQVHQMQGEIARLRAQVNSQTVTAQARPASWLDGANQYADRIRTALARGDFGAAQRELALATEDLRQAARKPEAQTQNALAQARRTLTSLQSQADALGRRAGALRRALAP